MEESALRFDALLRHGDDRLILGHRLSEWCGHGPILEEDIALTNVALDLLGQATFLLEAAAKVDRHGRSADELAFQRDPKDFRNLLLVEQANGDYAVTIVRQYLFDVYDRLVLEGLTASSDPELATFANGALKEASYHERHSGGWILRLGDGTEESHRRTQAAVDGLFNLTAELFEEDEVDREAADRGWFPSLASLAHPWRDTVEGTLREATLQVPDSLSRTAICGRAGLHTEHLDRLLTEMQSLARAHPGASW